MHEFSIDYLRCVRCQNRLELEKFKEDFEIIEGFLLCHNCNLKYPIISKIPILWDDFSSYLCNRPSLGSRLYLKSENQKMKSFLKNSLPKIKNLEDRTKIEERWTQIYLDSSRSKFYSTIKNHLSKLAGSKLVIEHGCSIGIISKFLADKNELVFGIDRSFHAIAIAKNDQKNSDFFVADSLNHPFGKMSFDLLVGLNILDIVEPLELLQVISKQVQKGSILITDPYDYERGTKSVKQPLNSVILRKELGNFGFRISSLTKKPSFIPWNLNLNNRIKLAYKVDLVIAKK